MPVVRRNESPWSIRRAGQRQHLLRNLQGALVGQLFSPAGLLQSLAFVTIIGHFRQPPLLLFFGCVQPELDQHYPIVRQLAFELTNLSSSDHHALTVKLTINLAFHHSPVPPAIEKGKLSTSGHSYPETVEVSMKTIILCRGMCCMNLEPTGIQRVDERADGVPFAGSFPTFQQHNHRNPGG